MIFRIFMVYCKCEQTFLAMYNNNANDVIEFDKI